MVGELEFEKPVVQLREKIAELKEFTKRSEVDLSSEIEKLESRLLKLEKEIYENIKPWDRVQIARHPNRPTTLDYISLLFTDFFECHGDRTLRLLDINVVKIRRKIFAAILECLIQKVIVKHFD